MQPVAIKLIWWKWLWSIVQCTKVCGNNCFAGGNHYDFAFFCQTTSAWHRRWSNN